MNAFNELSAAARQGLPKVLEVDLAKALGPLLQLHGLHGEADVVKTVLSRRNVQRARNLRPGRPMVCTISSQKVPTPVVRLEFASYVDRVRACVRVPNVVGKELRVGLFVFGGLVNGQVGDLPCPPVERLRPRAPLVVDHHLQRGWCTVGGLLPEGSWRTGRGSAT